MLDSVAVQPDRTAEWLAGSAPSPTVDVVQWRPPRCSRATARRATNTKHQVTDLAPLCPRGDLNQMNEPSISGFRTC
jgi:hypothetical protein